MAGVTAVVTGYVYENFGRTAAYTTVASAIFIVTAIGLWLAKDAWSLKRPITDD